MNNLECQICCEQFCFFKIIKCDSCNGVICKSCVEKFIEINKSCKCILCNKEWDIFFKNKNFGTSLLMKLQKIETEKYFLIEKSYIEKTMIYFKYRDMGNEHKNLSERYDELFYKVDDMTIDEIVNHPIMIDVMKSIKTDCKYHIRGIINYYKERHAKLGNQFLMCFNDCTDPDDKVHEYYKVSLCPNERCNGIILDDDYICKICKTKICIKCHLIEYKDHSCNVTDVKTINFINKTCKPCPNCFTKINKTDGCDQMWCTVCKTAFNYNTLKIETGYIHNPHFFDYMRKNNIEIPRYEEANLNDNYYFFAPNPDAFCDHPDVVVNRCRLLHSNILNYQGKTYKHYFYTLLSRLCLTTYNKCFEMVRTYFHNNDIDIEPVEPFKLCYKLRCLYVENSVSEGLFLNSIYLMYKKEEYKNIILKEHREHMMAVKYLIINAKKYIEELNSIIINKVEKYLNDEYFNYTDKEWIVIINDIFLQVESINRIFILDNEINELFLQKCYEYEKIYKEKSLLRYYRRDKYFDFYYLQIQDIKQCMTKSLNL